MTIKTFRGGIHPPEYKELTQNSVFEKVPAPGQIFLPLTQHLGRQAIPVVKKGSVVTAGMLVAQADGFISAPIHSPVCGTVANLGKQITSSGFPKDTITIITNGQTEAAFMSPMDPETITPDDIRKRVADAGIVGQGGAAFPTSVKLTPPPEKLIEFVILNGCECEPYLTRDYRFMLERPDAVIGGLKLILKVLGVQKGIMGIENNKPAAIEKMKNYLRDEKDLSVVVVKTKYPQGAEKMLIKAITGREVPPGKLPMDVGAVMQNVGTAVAIYDAITKGEPLITAALTVSGKGIKNPKNLIVPVGTPIKDVIDHCGGLTDNAAKIIVGGPMMGAAQYDLSSPVMKATSGILVLTKDEVETKQETTCVRCGKCVEVCPLNLLPTRLARLTQLQRYEDAEMIGITVCMECGTCAYTCPSNIPLVQWIRLGKQKVFRLQKERSASEN